jgi:hypothetical protein
MVSKQLVESLKFLAIFVVVQIGSNQRSAFIFPSPPQR